MELRSGTNYWTSSERVVPCEDPLPRRVETVIVGAGISGAFAAYELAHRGFPATVLERKTVASGSTSASTAILSYELDMPLVELRRRFGTKYASAIYTACFTELAKLKQLCRTLGDGIGYEELPSLYLASSPLANNMIEQECFARKMLGFETIHLDPQAVASRNSIKCHGALRTPDAAIVNPVALSHRLLRDAQALGTKVYEERSLLDIESERNSVRLTLSDGETVEADRVIITCGYESPRWMPWKNGKLISSYVAVSQAVQFEKLFGERLCFWETAVPYLYGRPGMGPRILFGGADREIRSPLLRDLLRTFAEHDLRQRVRKLTDSEIELSNYWNGSFAESPDGLPLIGSMPGSPRIFYTYASGGNGTLFAFIGAMMARDWVTGYPLPYADYFGWSRLEISPRSYTSHQNQPYQAA